MSKLATVTYRGLNLAYYQWAFLRVYPNVPVLQRKPVISPLILNGEQFVPFLFTSAFHCRNDTNTYSQFSISLRGIPSSWFIEMRSFGLACFLEVQCLIYYTNWALDSDEKMLWCSCEVTSTLIATVQCKLWSKVPLLTEINFVVHYSSYTSVSELLNPCNHDSLSTDTNLGIRFYFVSQAIHEQVFQVHTSCRIEKCW